MLGTIKKLIPQSVFKLFQPAYHYLLALAGAVIYRFPSRKILVIGVTGTKGKSTTTEILYHIFKSAGKKVAVQNTIHFVINDKEEKNLFKMTMPGRFFIQRFLHEAVSSGCDVVILEMSSEGAKQFRHKFIDLDALIFTNLAPEHIESHGSYDKYVEAKLSIARVAKALIVNKDDQESAKFLSLAVPTKIPYSLKDAIGVSSDEKGSTFQVGKVVVHSKLPGLFNVSNMLGAMACAKHFGISEEVAKKGIESMHTVRGRMEKIEEGQKFDVVVDYAHTPDSLRAVYSTYKNHKTICILGNTGGGRDKWKRPEMAKVADEYCSEIILTNEDPYDEDPKQILEDMKVGIKTKPLRIILDRREAIREALRRAKGLTSTSAKATTDKQGTGDKNTIAVLITGKGTDPYIMGPNGSKTPWDDATVAREELEGI